MDKESTPKNTPQPRAYSKIYSGDTIESSFVMEPGEQYDHDLGDFYSIDAKGIGKHSGGLESYMTFSSFEQLEEFSDQLVSYVIDEKDKLREEGRIFLGDLCNRDCLHYAKGTCPYKGRHRLDCARYKYTRKHKRQDDSPEQTKI